MKDMKIVKCSLVKGENNERVAYDSAKAALLASRVFNKKYDKFSRIRYCPACECWHITTNGTKNYEIAVSYKTCSVLVSEGLYPRDIDELSREAEEAKNRAYVVKKYWKILDLDAKIICRGAYYLRGIIDLIEDKKEREYLLQGIVDKETRYVKRLFENIDKRLEDLESTTDYKEKRKIRDEIKLLVNQEPYVFYIFPDKKDEIKKRLFTL